MLEKILEEIDNLKKLYKKSAFALIDEGNLPCKYDKSDTESAKVQALSEAMSIIRKHMNEGKDINVPAKDGWIPVEVAPPPIGQRLQATIKHHKWIADYDSGWVPEEEKTIHPEWTEVCEIVCIGAMWFYYCKETDYEKEIAYINPLKDLSAPVSEIIAWQPLPEQYRPEKGMK